MQVEQMISPSDKGNKNLTLSVLGEKYLKNFFIVCCAGLRAEMLNQKWRRN